MKFVSTLWLYGVMAFYRPPPPLCHVAAMELPHPHPDLVRRSELESQTSTTSLQSFMKSVAPPSTTLALLEACPVCRSLEEIEQDQTFLERLIGQVTQFLFGNGSIFSKLMNGLLRVFQQSNEDFFIRLADDMEIPVDTLLPQFVTVASQLASMADKIRTENSNTVQSATTSNTAATTPSEYQYLSSMTELSASSMEAVSTLLDLMITDMSNRETVNLNRYSCNLVLITDFVNSNVMPNIASVVDEFYNIMGMSQNGTITNTTIVEALANATNGKKNSAVGKFTDALLESCSKNSGDESILTSILADTSASLVVDLNIKKNIFLGNASTVQPAAEDSLNFFEKIALIVGFAVQFPLAYFPVLLVLWILVLTCDDSPFIQFVRGGPLRLLGFTVLLLLISIVALPFVYVLSVFSFAFQVLFQDRTQFRELYETRTFDSSFQDMEGLISELQYNRVGMSQEDFECQMEALSCKNEALLKALPL
jgi:hypothetical protein